MQTKLNYINNRELFSNHFIFERLPKESLWLSEIEDKFEQIKKLYNSTSFTNRNEAQLEEELIKPLIKILGFEYEVQVPLKTASGMKRPDFALFIDRVEKEAAQGLHQDSHENYFGLCKVILESKRWGRNLDNKSLDSVDKSDMGNPSTQIDYYLRFSDVKWGILTNGQKWRLYNKETSYRLSIFFEINLFDVIQNNDIDSFRYFYNFFRKEAFIRGTNNTSFLERVVAESIAYSKKIGDSLKNSIYSAVLNLSSGFFDYKNNQLDKNDPIHLKIVYDNSLILLYRLLFILYAESRGLLPLKNETYQRVLSFQTIKNDIASLIDSSDKGKLLTNIGTNYWYRLQNLFEVINEGNEPYNIPPYNGGLFSPIKNIFLKEKTIPDLSLAKAVDLISRSEDKNFLDYSSLGIRQFGSIYEGLLDFKLNIANSDLALVKSKNTEIYVDINDIDNKKVIENVPKGSLYLSTGNNERKNTGSYYTPQYIVEYIIENTLGPKINEIEKQSKSGSEFKDRVLKLKILDPAMGSGHFLVEAVDYLAKKLADHPEINLLDDGEEEINYFKRMVVEQCIFGVDINYLAVELAKLSLWLHTVSDNKPLSFLDHHLKCGNSLVGTTFEDLRKPIIVDTTNKTKLQLTKGEEEYFRTLGDSVYKKHFEKMVEYFKQIQKISSNNIEDVKKKEEIYKKFQDFKNAFKRLFDMKTSTAFGNEINPSAFEVMKTSPLSLETQQFQDKWTFVAEDLSIKNNFFNWELEFPEAFFEKDDPGFDMVIGNPPYIRVQNLKHEIIDFLTKQYFTPTGKLDISILFFEKSLNLINSEGKIGFISSSQWINTDYGENLRILLSDKGYLSKLLNFGSLPVFEKVDTYPAIFVLGKKRNSFLDYIKLSKENYKEINNLDLKFKKFNTEELSSEPWQFSDFDLIKHLNSEKLNWFELSSYGKAYVGNITGYDKAFVVDEKIIYAKQLEREILIPYAFRGEEVVKYSHTVPKYHVIYPYKIVDNKQQLISEKDLELNYPNIFNYLFSFQTELKMRKDSRKLYANNKQWYKHVRPGSFKYISPKKIHVKGVSTRLEAGLLNENTDFSGSNCPAIILFDNKYMLEILGILNSKLISFYLNNICPKKLGGCIRYNSKNISKTPIIHDSSGKLEPMVDKIINLNMDFYMKKNKFISRIVDNFNLEKISNKLNLFFELGFNSFIKEIEKSGKDKISLKEQEAWEEYFCEYKQTLSSLTNQINEIDNELNQLVYGLYKLSKDEIRIIEDVIK